MKIWFLTFAVLLAGCVSRGQYVRYGETMEAVGKTEGIGVDSHNLDNLERCNHALQECQSALLKCDGQP